MRRVAAVMAMAVCAGALFSVVVVAAQEAQAQPQEPTADEVVERHLSALGGRAALEKLTSRVSKGTVKVSAQGLTYSGVVETYNKVPNLARLYIRLDLSSEGGSEVVFDQRCDGKTAFEINSTKGERDITGSRLQGLLNATFPTPLLNYRQEGAKIQVLGRELVNDRPAIVLLYSPKTQAASTASGSTPASAPTSKLYIDAKTYMLVRTVSRFESPDTGQEIEQTNSMSDFRAVDGVKVPFLVTIANPVQTLTFTFTSVQQNTPIDDAMFSKPAKQASLPALLQGRGAF
jgi:outer membrane lipoprotein-sorting protein